jgi:choline monooxygenase
MDLSDYTFNPDLARASTIPARWYTEPAFLDSERSAVFGRTWQAVGHAAAVAAPGSYFACEITGEPVVVARGKDGQLRAFSNVCRHRGSILTEGAGQASVIRCPYHAWTYSLDGSLLGQPEFEGVQDWDRSQICLPQFAVETWGPFVFVNLDRSAAPLHEVLGAIPGEIARMGCPLDRLKFSCRRDYVIECNWKVYIDNYLEGYHLPAAHPSLFRELDYAPYRVDTFRY